MNMKDELQQKQNDQSGAGKLWSKPELKVLQASSEDIMSSGGVGLDFSSPSS
ncbi:hypothetical protein ACR9YC_08820 [Parasphingorhabdus sp. DH2-15]|uniref:hypothetical protein n=1 Tax=Parasphingorhabdus sp. DH2-15 TaxID=3444112 RepID=UPI003F684124